MGLKVYVVPTTNLLTGWGPVDSRNTSQWVVGLILITSLSLWVGTVGSVAAESGGPLADDTNSTYSGDTNSTLDDFDTVTSVTDETLDGTSETLDGTGETLDDTTDIVTSSEPIQNTTDTVESTLEEDDGSLADYEALTELLPLDVENLDDTTLSRDATATLDAPSTPTPSRSDFAAVTGTPADADSGTGDAGQWSLLSGLTASHPSAPDGGVAVAGLGAVIAGVAARQLTGSSPVLQGVDRGARRALDRLFRFFAPLRYSQHDDSDPLEHEKRATVFEAVEDSPGVYLAELSEQLDVSRSTLRHHVRVLEAEGLIAAARVRGYRRFYPAHTEAVELAAALNDEATAPIVDALARLGTASVTALADVIDRDISTVTYHLGRLEEDGVVTRERDGRAIVNRLAPEAREALSPGADGYCTGEGSGHRTDDESLVSAD